MDKKALLMFLANILCFPAYAELVDLSQDYWQCTAFDTMNKHWLTTSNYQLTALNKAYENCKKESTMPQSCKVAREHCEAFISGSSTRPMWQCTALDDLATPFMSTIYRNPDDAVLAAKAYCRQESPYPDTCYAYLFACKNLNEQN